MSKFEYIHKRFIRDTETGELRDITNERDYSDKAHELADLNKYPYSIYLKADTLSNGSICWIARHPEFEVCKAQGDSAAMALLELESVRLEVIDWYLQEGWDIPQPKMSSDEDE